MIASTDQEEKILPETLDQLDLSSEGAWAAIEAGIGHGDPIGIDELNIICADEILGPEAIGELEQASECNEAALTRTGMKVETPEVEEMVHEVLWTVDDEEDKKCRQWLQEQKELRVKARHIELDLRQAKEKKEKLRKEQLEHVQKWEEERIKAASKKGKKGKKAKKI